MRASILALIATTTTTLTLASALNPSKPYKLSASISTRDLFARRDGYSPSSTFCGIGDTCGEACGTSYRECASRDAATLRCYNPSIGQKCCANRSGDACDDGFYCTEDGAGETWCCPDDMDLDACAAAYGVDALTSLSDSSSAPSSNTTSSRPTASPHHNTTTIHAATFATSTTSASTSSSPDILSLLILPPSSANSSRPLYLGTGTAPAALGTGTGTPVYPTASGFGFGIGNATRTYAGLEGLFTGAAAPAGGRGGEGDAVRRAVVGVMGLGAAAAWML
ncbi:hypothetical protein BDY21DRAFT_399031 [Lineolata rhizophorae]|uniref:Uncharacterized protein n=1 Tax=Lineolata rhizophorae TaxID=578093 RepID=A0A6A6NT20_9PEZI|nr:hypothetical protein BDY21DRAFT_399031 [Lineolata rhizophorae]